MAFMAANWVACIAAGSPTKAGSAIPKSRVVAAALAFGDGAVVGAGRVAISGVPNEMVGLADSALRAGADVGVDVDVVR
jgi:hypothetical protein